jgi:dolichol-phosphate mannosyltransferase
LSQVAVTSELPGGRPGRLEGTLRFGRFAAVGASGYAVNLAVFALLVHALDLPSPAAAAAAFCIALANNYLWNRLWTFRDTTGSVRSQGTRFAVVSLVGLGFNLVLLSAFLSTGLGRLGSQACAVALVLPLNYLGNRHWTFAEREAAGMRDRAQAYASIAGWWAASRALVLAAALVVQALGWPRKSWYPSVFHEPLALLRAWDGRWYLTVAERGYFVVPRHQSDPAFFPLYPLLVNGLHVLGLGRIAAGLLLANLAFLLGLVALYELARTWLPEPDARRTAIYAALFPFGFVFSMVYPESIVLAAMAFAGVFAARRQWVAAGICAALATLGRPEGLFVALPLAMLAARRWPQASIGERTRALWGALAAPAALLGLAAYQRTAVGDPLAFSHAQRMWGRWFSIGGIHRTVTELLHAPELHREWLYRDLTFLVGYLACLYLAHRVGVPRSWVLAGALVLLLPLWSGSVTSVARFGLLVPPVYAGLARLGRNRLVDWSLRATAAGLLGVGSATILLHWP